MSRGKQSQVFMKALKREAEANGGENIFTEQQVCVFAPVEEVPKLILILEFFIDFSVVPSAVCGRSKIVVGAGQLFRVCRVPERSGIPAQARRSQVSNGHLTMRSASCAATFMLPSVCNFCHVYMYSIVSRVNATFCFV
jgi:hypothetical protein